MNTTTTNIDTANFIPLYTLVKCSNCNGWGTIGYARTQCPTCKGEGSNRIPVVEKREVQNGAA